MLQIALIGVTGFGEVHYRALRKLEDEGLAKIAAATVINRDEAAMICEELESAGCRLYSDYREMLEAEKGRIDLCSIPTGIAWHSRMTVDALQAGCHVLVEKPVAGTLEEVEEMIAARDAAGRRVFVGFQDLYMPHMDEMKKRILAGEIGKLEFVRVKASWPRPAAYYDRNNWAGRIKSGDQWVYDSPANNALAHYLMAGLYVCGGDRQAASITSGEGELYRAKPIESFDTMSVRFHTSTGADVQFVATHSGEQASSPQIWIQGDKGSIHWYFNDRIEIEPAGDSLECPAGPPCSFEMFRKIVDALKTDRDVGCTLEIAREHTRAIKALHEHCPIHEAPGHPAKEQPELIVIDGVVEAIHACHDQGKLFSEVNTPWAKPFSAFTL